MEISFITVSTTDIDGSIAFYEKILDFQTGVIQTGVRSYIITFLDSPFG